MLFFSDYWICSSLQFSFLCIFCKTLMSCKWRNVNIAYIVTYLRVMWRLFFHLVQILHFAANLLVYLHNLSPKASLNVLLWGRQGRFDFHILLRKTERCLFYQYERLHNTILGHDSTSDDTVFISENCSCARLVAHSSRLVACSASGCRVLGWMYFIFYCLI